MASRCSICRRQDREEIDASLLRGTPLRDLEAGHGGTTKSALDRHRAHVSERVAKAADAREVLEGGRLLRKLQRLEERAETLLSKAERKGQFGPAAALVRELRELLRLFGEISGELKGGTVVRVNVVNVVDEEKGRKIAEMYLRRRGLAP